MRTHLLRPVNAVYSECHTHEHAARVCELSQAFCSLYGHFGPGNHEPSLVMSELRTVGKLPAEAIPLPFCPRLPGASQQEEARANEQRHRKGHERVDSTLQSVTSHSPRSPPIFPIWKCWSAIRGDRPECTLALEYCQAQKRRLDARYHVFPGIGRGRKAVTADTPYWF